MLRNLPQDQPEEILRRRWVTKDGSLIWVGLKYRNMLYVEAAGNVVETRFVVVTYSEPASGASVPAK